MHGTVKPRGREWLWRTKCQWCPRKPPSVVHWSTDAMAWRQMWRWIYYGGLYLCAYRVASAGLSTLSSVYLGLGPETQRQYHIPSVDPYPQSRNPKTRSPARPKWNTKKLKIEFMAAPKSCVEKTTQVTNICECFGRESWLFLNEPVAWFRATDSLSKNLNNKYSIVTQAHKARKWWLKPNFDSDSEDAANS